MRRLIIIPTVTAVLVVTALLAITLNSSDASSQGRDDEVVAELFADVADHDAPSAASHAAGPAGGADHPSGPASGTVAGSGTGGAGPGGGGGDGHLPELPEPGEEFDDEGDPELGELDPVDPVNPDGTPEGIGFKSPWSAQVNDGMQGSQDLKDGRGCSSNCITRGVAIGRGTGAELVVETDTPARLWLVVWKEGSYHSMRYAGDERRTSFSSLFDDLEPGTTYQAAAFAQDAEGFQSETYGTFTTRRRHVRVEFGATVITGTPWTAVRYSVYPRVDHQWLPKFAATGLTEPYHHPMGGAQVVQHSDVGTHLDVATQVVASKKTGKNDVCEGWHLPSDTHPANTTNCLTWGMAPDGITAGIELDGSPSGDGPPVPRTFWRLLSGDNGDGLHFTTSVTVSVWYG
jgi:hypothetical protein